MPATSPAAHLATAPISDLISILMQQFKRPFVEQGIDTAPEALTPLIEAAAEHKPLPAPAEAVKTLLRSIVQESETALRDGFGFTFEDSLHKTMDDVTGWTSTAEFLEKANDKSTAELRISTASLLLTFLGDTSALTHVRTVLAEDSGAEDVDGVLAMRALQHLESHV